MPYALGGMRADAADAVDHVRVLSPGVVTRWPRLAGRFRSRALILNFMAALAAGNPDARVAG